MIFKHLRRFWDERVENLWNKYKLLSLFPKNFWLWIQPIFPFLVAWSWFRWSSCVIPRVPGLSLPSPSCSLPPPPIGGAKLHASLKAHLKCYLFKETAHDPLAADFLFFLLISTELYTLFCDSFLSTLLQTLGFFDHKPLKSLAVLVYFLFTNSSFRHLILEWLYFWIYK